MALIRTFVAVECSARLQAALGNLAHNLAEVVDGARWIQSENLHVTLKFLGEVEDRELHAICRQVERAVDGIPAFGALCKGIGAFPSVERPNTIWADIVDPDNALTMLQQSVADNLGELGFPVERRPFKAHVTLGRTKSRHFQRPEWAQSVERYQKHEFGSLEVSEVVVYSSELERRHPVYTPLARCPLA